MDEAQIQTQIQSEIQQHDVAWAKPIAAGFATTQTMEASREELRVQLLADYGLPAEAAKPTGTAGQLNLPAVSAPAESAELLEQQAQQQAEQQADPGGYQAFPKPASVAEFNFGLPPLGVENSQQQEMAMRTLFHQAEIPAAIANEVGRQWNKAALHPPDANQIALGAQQCSVALNRMWGNDTDHHLAVAQAEVQRMAKTNPEIIQMLEVSGLGNSPWLASTLFNLARARGRAK